MKVFHCSHCENLVFFENSLCVRCGNALAYLPDLGIVGSIALSGDGFWHSPSAEGNGITYRLCENYSTTNICNWAMVAADSHSLCISCRLTQVFPDASQAEARACWHRLEVAKRRLIYTL